MVVSIGIYAMVDSHQQRVKGTFITPLFVFHLSTNPLTPGENAVEQWELMSVIRLQGGTIIDDVEAI